MSRFTSFLIAYALGVPAIIHCAYCGYMLAKEEDKRKEKIERLKWLENEIQVLENKAVMFREEI